MTSINANSQPDAGLSSASAEIDVIVEKLRLAIRKSHYPELRRLQCESTDGALTLKGRLSTYYLRQLAVCMAKQTAGNVPVQFSIEMT